ncbi:MAG: hypothetical protein CM15mP86_18810 [Gammaproteobacteria bacterium]|nr:MAG: hypothetical protein CM15mP86_18810 [Gammaproteobacteria bacterium]
MEMGPQYLRFGSCKKIQHEIEIGQVWGKSPYSRSFPFFSFTGWKQSFFKIFPRKKRGFKNFILKQKTLTKDGLKRSKELKKFPSIWSENGFYLNSTKNYRDL